MFTEDQKSVVSGFFFGAKQRVIYDIHLIICTHRKFHTLEATTEAVIGRQNILEQQISNDRSPQAARLCLVLT